VNGATTTELQAPLDAIALQRTMTIAEAAEATGASVDAIRSRVDRGTLPAARGRDGKRRIPASELYKAGLLDPLGSGEDAADRRSAPQLHRRGNTAAAVDLNDLIRRLVDAETQVRVKGELAQHAESTARAERQAREQLEASLHQTRSETVALQAKLQARHEVEQTIRQQLDEATARARELEQRLTERSARRRWFGAGRNKRTSV